jgi:hypothetical protein
MQTYKELKNWKVERNNEYKNSYSFSENVHAFLKNMVANSIAIGMKIFSKAFRRIRRSDI